MVISVKFRLTSFSFFERPGVRGSLEDRKRGMSLPKEWSGPPYFPRGRARRNPAAWPMARASAMLSGFMGIAALGQVPPDQFDWQAASSRKLQLIDSGNLGRPSVTSTSMVGRVLACTPCTSNSETKTEWKNSPFLWPRINARMAVVEIGSNRISCHWSGWFG